VRPQNEVFQLLTLARMVEPTSKLEAIRVLEEIGITPPSYPTIKRRLQVYATEQWRQRLAGACAAHIGLGPATLVVYDVTTLHFETDEGDGFREPGFSKERRLDPQITVGLLTDVSGFPLMVHAFEGNKAETKTILPVLGAFAAAHQLPEVTVVADAGMLSDANLASIEDAGLRFIVGARIPDIPTRSANGAGATKTSRSLTDRSSPSRGGWAPRPTHGNGRSSSSTGPTGHTARYAASISRSRRRRRPSPGRRRSSGTGSSSSPVAPRASTVT
jgi:hypothetical protein